MCLVPLQHVNLLRSAVLWLILPESFNLDAAPVAFVGASGYENQTSLRANLACS